MHTQASHVGFLHSPCLPELVSMVQTHAPDCLAEGLGHHVWTFRTPHRSLCVLAYVYVHCRLIKPEPESTETCGGKWLQQRQGNCELAYFCSRLIIRVLTHGSKTSTPNAATPGIVRLACSETFCAAWY